MSLATLPNLDDPTEAYDLAVQRYRRGDAPSPVDWKPDPGSESMSGRHELRQVLADRGFELK